MTVQEDTENTADMRGVRLAGPLRVLSEVSLPGEGTAVGFEHARQSLRGLAIGDAFGERVRLGGNGLPVTALEVTAAPWPWTDDTEMACSVFAVLVRHGRIDQDELAASFAQHFDPARGYGSGAERRLQQIHAGQRWQEASTSGRGSWGNGAAMRVAPLGAWFGENLPRALVEAERSAVITHSHPEGVAGAVAVAAAAGLRAAATDLAGPALLDEVVQVLQSGRVRNGLARASELLRADASPEDAARALGSGRAISAQDTVPLALWLAARHSSDYVEAMLTAARVAEDVDTVCAITGGVIAAGSGEVVIPADWQAACEPLPTWLNETADKEHPID